MNKLFKGIVVFMIFSILVAIPLVAIAAKDPHVKSKYKYTLTFKEARVVETGSHSAGNQWGFAVKNETKSTKVIYKRQSTSNPITTEKSIQTNWDGCYIGFHEYDKAQDDYFKKVYKQLKEGENVLYCVVRDTQYKDYWTKWKVTICRTTN